jgi:hypothetical protein
VTGGTNAPTDNNASTLNTASKPVSAQASGRAQRRPGTRAELAPLFAETVGLDPDPDMVTQGRRAAAECGVGGIRWMHARAEDLPDAAPRPYRLVTFGQSFPWDERPCGFSADRAVMPVRSGEVCAHP